MLLQLSRQAFVQLLAISGAVSAVLLEFDNVKAKQPVAQGHQLISLANGLLAELLMKTTEGTDQFRKVHSKR